MSSAPPDSAQFSKKNKKENKTQLSYLPPPCLSASLPLYFPSSGLHFSLELRSCYLTLHQCIHHLLFPHPPLCHIPCVCCPNRGFCQTYRTLPTFHQTNVTLVADRLLILHFSSTVLSSVSQAGLYITQQSHPAGCQICLSCRIYVWLHFCRPDLLSGLWDQAAAVSAFIR